MNMAALRSFPRPAASPAAAAGLGRRWHLALLLLRIAAGAAFVYHGAAILFGAWAGPGPVAFAASLHAPAAVGYLVGLAQLAGGLALLSGILFRLGAACLVVVMIGAIALVHWPHGFSIGHGGMEYALAQLLIAVALLLTGPGAWSLGRWLPAPLGAKRG